MLQNHHLPQIMDQYVTNHHGVKILLNHNRCCQMQSHDGLMSDAVSVTQFLGIPTIPNDTPLTDHQLPHRGTRTPSSTNAYQPKVNTSAMENEWTPEEAVGLDESAISEADETQASHIYQMYLNDDGEQSGYALAEIPQEEGR